MGNCECGGEVVVTEANATTYTAECQACGFVFGETAGNTAEI